MKTFCEVRALSGKRCPKKFVTQGTRDSNNDLLFVLGNREGLLKRKKKIERWLIDVKEVLIKDENFENSNPNSKLKENIFFKQAKPIEKNHQIRESFGMNSTNYIFHDKETPSKISNI